jgi:2,3-bisphosphoglycerate-independent phosphoglycerate mutase
VVEQWLARVSNALRRGALAEIPAWHAFLSAVSELHTIHVMGLWSDGGVHSHSEHLYLLLKALHAEHAGPIALHLITDGRDTAPRRAGTQCAELERALKDLPRVTVASISGRYYAMDRDKRWERTKLAFGALVRSVDTPLSPSLAQAIESAYAQNLGDEFIPPTLIGERGTAHLSLRPQDGFLFFNFREDRARQIVRAIFDPSFIEFPRPADFRPLPMAQVLCLTQYDESFKLPVLFPPQTIQLHLGEVLSRAGRTQLRVAETEKYPHVTYFFNGGEEAPFPGEERTLIPSPRDVATYDLKPEMSAHEVCTVVEDAIRSHRYDLIVVNFANGDMVGHTGVLEAAIKAVETVDSCLGIILNALREHHGAALILADHGNAEQMIDYETGTPHTAHTTFPVPLFLVDYRKEAFPRDSSSPRRSGALCEGGALCDVAPTMLALMGIDQPTEMSGRSLLSSPT